MTLSRTAAGSIGAIGSAAPTVLISALRASPPGSASALPPAET
ncbi:hypothetical protein OMP38_32440 [Cohnella ginsengisoli]|uniref:Uncharacterized protein n=1 Tax=Cohnella ginsengisoli TaxID=425004 RepID=A0A9X4KMF3_9BACL|nr:hypothetical protein [Cohnella ginsengisoli]MDG0795014.1 hypothetical protein [Cohnella ginsengisoli]